jgi:hypothetical protein
MINKTTAPENRMHVGRDSKQNGIRVHFHGSLPHNP